ncbi:hypothetical protein OG369_38470 [Streptomyces sp. NBC_01221]|uniref:hypothetical protein n=1 Tax=Streptomyces sp. NBC_01221 TaxID=2903782 RepID=UPI00225A86FD|nr:hypothetical protein [Streptomyces sp. NBC_01221]MCX4791755.1 hypothetical protein [Streptomyces sp. NBC_01221]
MTDRNAAREVLFRLRLMHPVGDLLVRRDRRIVATAGNPLLERVNAYVMRWMRKKFKRLRGRKRAQTAWNQAVTRRPRFFAHWVLTTHAPRVW